MEFLMSSTKTSTKAAKSDTVVTEKAVAKNPNKLSAVEGTKERKTRSDKGTRTQYPEGSVAVRVYVTPEQREYLREKEEAGMTQTSYMQFLLNKEMDKTRKMGGTDALSCYGRYCRNPKINDQIAEIAKTVGLKDSELSLFSKFLKGQAALIAEFYKEIGKQQSKRLDTD
jgi:hypothetical protein